MSFTVLANWKFRQADKDQKWTSVKHDRPNTEIFPDLLENGLIPDPFLDLNERSVQWVGLADWEYSTEFEYKPSGKVAELVFEGLDTYATVYLNGQKLFYSNNMFHVHKIDVKNQLKIGKNELLIRFNSALRESKLEESKHRPHQLWNGDSARLFARKAQYHYGWDWGPTLLTCGPWKPITLRVYDAKIEDVYVHGNVSERLDAEVTIGVDIKTTIPTVADIDLFDPQGKKIFSKTLNVQAGAEIQHLKTPTSLSKPELWYPLRYGKQNFYKATVTLKDESGKTLESFTRTNGLRRVELVEGPLDGQEGSSFFFKVNNIPIYMAGSNWIPAHNYLTRLTAKDYQEWVDIAVEGNQNMLRVWAGGIFEDDSFYEACDNAGVLVWQDFLFGCGEYPYYKTLAESVKKECEDQLSRLRNFPSIIVYAGNNEDYQVAESVDIKWDPNNKDYENSGFPARAYYEKLLPEVLEAVIPNSVYRFGCPYGGSFSGDLKVGDVHQWNVWHGTQEKYQDWAKLAGRFVSEFGMLAFPSIETLKKAITDESELYPQSESMDLHDKADGFERRLALYVMENFKVTSMDLESWIYITQLMQSECLAYAYRCWRRNWKGPNKEYTSGALVWQINDCWPVTSWAICDHYKTPKLAYYAIKRESEPIALGIYRNATLTDSSADQKVEWLKEYDYKFDVWGVNMTLDEVEYDLVIKTFDVESGKLEDTIEKKSVKFAANQVTELVENLPVTRAVAVQAQIFNKKGDLIYSAADWPQPLKYVKFPKRNVSLKVEDGKVKINAERPVKGLELSYKGTKKVVFSDNGLDVFPGDTIVVEASGLTASDEVLFNYYCK